MVKHTQTIRWLQSTNCLSMFDHFVELALKALTRTKTLTNLFLKALMNYRQCYLKFFSENLVFQKTSAESRVFKYA